MAYCFPSDDDPVDPAWWAPLERVATLTLRSSTLPSLVVCEFMFMGRSDRGRRPRIWVYKHKWTRRHVNLDDAGHAYRWSGPSRYVPYRSLAAALAALDLDEVPDAWRAVSDVCDSCRAAVDGVRPPAR